MNTTPFISTKGLRSNRETAPGFWMVDILWFVLVDGNDTNHLDFGRMARALRDAVECKSLTIVLAKSELNLVPFGHEPV